MSVWTSEGAVPVRRGSRRLSMTPNTPITPFAPITPKTEVEDDPIYPIASSTSSSVATPRKLLVPKSSMIPRLKLIEEHMASSDEELALASSSESKRIRGRPPGSKNRGKSPGRGRTPTRSMTAIKTPASSAAAVKDAAAAAAATVTPSARKERTPPRSRSSSRTRKAAGGGAAAGGAAATPAATPAKRVAPVLNIDESPMLITRRSTRLARTEPLVHPNGHAVNGTAAKNTVALERESTEEWREKFTEAHPIFTKLFIPAMICLVYAVIIFGVGYYFDLHKKAPVWMDLAAQRVNEIYDDFMASRAADSSSPAAAAAGDAI